MKLLNTCREVMEAILEGKEVEFRRIDGCEWNTLKSLLISVGCIDDKTSYLYRIKLNKPSIDWTHVSDEFNFLARDKDGSCYLYVYKPEIEGHDCWTSIYGDYEDAAVLRSLEVGDCDWRDSLVMRPDNGED